MSSAKPDLSIVIPVYNEEAVLPALFARLYPALDALARSYEIVFVSDGSRDRSAPLLKAQNFVSQRRKNGGNTRMTRFVATFTLVCAHIVITKSRTTIE